MCLSRCVLVLDLSEVGGVESEISSQVTMANLRLSSSKAYSPKFVKQKIEVPHNMTPTHSHFLWASMLSLMVLERPIEALC